jgi:chromate transport protein ChrA
MQNRYWQILRTGFQLGSTIFGGITVAYPAIRRMAPIGFGLAEAEVDGLYAFAYILPGPSFLNLWGAVCMRVAGLPGAILGEAALLLPSTLLVLLLPQLGRFAWVAAHSGGMGAGAAWATVGLTLAAGLDGLRKMKVGMDRVVVALLFGLGALGLHSLVALAITMVIYGGVSLWRSRRGVTL